MSTTLKQLSQKIWDIMPNVGAKELYDEINNSIDTLNSNGFIQESTVEIEAASSGNLTEIDLDDATNQITSVVNVKKSSGFRLQPRSVEFLEKYSASGDLVYNQTGDTLKFNASEIASGSAAELVVYESLPKFTTFNSASSISVNEYFVPAISYLTIATLAQKDKYKDGNKTTLYLEMYNNEVEKLRGIVSTFKEKGY
ncbi:MAG: hypothetical protein KGY74_07690, partial [Candidatus Cloacimonetes bacterium]|nr:hypothetical protein [Candidatus Cloacimonadota bacterium]